MNLKLISRILSVITILILIAAFALALSGVIDSELMITMLWIGFCVSIAALILRFIHDKKTGEGKKVPAWRIALTIGIIIFALIKLGGNISSDSNSTNNEKSQRCGNCRGTGWDSSNDCECVWCGGDGETSWNP